MKICILSMQNVQNFGSLLQSYSLKKIIESLGHEVSFIDIKNIPEDYILLSEGMQYFSDEKEKYSRIKWKRYLSKVDKYFFNRIKIRRLANKQDDMFEKFRMEQLKVTEFDNQRQYDICVIGSDEVFNCLTNSRWGFTSQLFGNVEQAKKVITYAASCGATKYELLPAKVADRIRQVFKNISAFSVRDENTRQFVQKLSDNDINVHLDPVVVGNFDKEMVESQAVNDLPEHFCVVYSYYNRVYKPDEIVGISRFCKKHNLEVIAVGAPQMWIKKFLVLSPFQVLKVFSMADFVFTDTFHGTIFASKYSQKFAVMARPSNELKLLDLVFKLGIKEHLINQISEIENTYDIVNDFEKRNRIFQSTYKDTVDYLKENI